MLLAELGATFIFRVISNFGALRAGEEARVIGGDRPKRSARSAETESPEPSTASADGRGAPGSPSLGAGGGLAPPRPRTAGDPVSPLGRGSGSAGVSGRSLRLERPEGSSRHRTEGRRPHVPPGSSPARGRRPPRTPASGPRGAPADAGACTRREESSKAAPCSADRGPIA
jgi:hypothetical protein